MYHPGLLVDKAVTGDSFNPSVVRGHPTQYGSNVSDHTGQLASGRLGGGLHSGGALVNPLGRIRPFPTGPFSRLPGVGPTAQAGGSFSLSPAALAEARARSKRPIGINAELGRGGSIFDTMNLSGNGLRKHTIGINPHAGGRPEDFHRQKTGGSIMGLAELFGGTGHGGSIDFGGRHVPRTPIGISHNADEGRLLGSRNPFTSVPSGGSLRHMIRPQAMASQGLFSQPRRRSRQLGGSFQDVLGPLGGIASQVASGNVDIGDLRRIEQSLKTQKTGRDVSRLPISAAGTGARRRFNVQGGGLHSGGAMLPRWVQGGGLELQGGSLRSGGSIPASVLEASKRPVQMGAPQFNFHVGRQLHG